MERPPELGFLPAGQRKSSMGDPDMLENELFFTYGWQRWVNNSKFARKSNQKYLWTYFENCTTKSRLFFCFLLWKITLWLVFSAFRKQKQKSTLTKRTLRACNESYSRMKEAVLLTWRSNPTCDFM